MREDRKRQRIERKLQRKNDKEGNKKKKRESLAANTHRKILCDLYSNEIHLLTMKFHATMSIKTRNI